MKTTDRIPRFAIGCLMSSALAVLCGGRVRADLPPQERREPPRSYRATESPGITCDSRLTSTHTQEVLHLRASVTPLEGGLFRWEFEIDNPSTNRQRISHVTLGGWHGEFPQPTNLGAPPGWRAQIVLPSQGSAGEGLKINFSVLPNQPGPFAADTPYLIPGSVRVFRFDLPANATTRTGQASALGTFGFSGQTLGYQSPSVRFTVDEITVTPEAPTICEGAFGMLRVHPAAPADGLWVTLRSGDPTAVVVSERVWLAPGETEKRFPVTLRPVRAATAVNVTASLPGSQVTTTLTVRPPGIRILFPSNQEIPAGATFTATLARECASPWAVTARLHSDNPIVKVPPCPVTIPAGQESVTFPVETLGLKAEAEFSLVTAGLTATSSVGAATASLRVQASPQFACSQDICPGYTAIGDVLTLVAGEGGVFLFRGVGRGFTPTLRLTVAGAGAPEQYSGAGQLVEVTKHLVWGGPHWMEMLNNGKPAVAADAAVFVQRLNHPENARVCDPLGFAAHERPVPWSG